jgi:SAM-dependent methyltransferase
MAEPPLVTLRGRLAQRFRKYWRRINLRNIGRRDAHLRLELLYRLNDPWKMESELEQFRFRETNRIVQRELVDPAARVGSILEIGSGEGHQSEHLMRLCDKLTGIEISPTAVARARKRLPGAEFESGDVTAQPWSRQADRFDIVTGFEMLYYVKDVDAILATMSTLGRACAVSYYGGEAPKMDPFLEKVPGAKREVIEFQGVQWTVICWRNTPAARAALNP